MKNAGAKYCTVNQCVSIVCRLCFSWGELSFSSHSVPFEPTKFTNFFLITMFHRKEMYIYFLTNI